jgi:hypothetical protein
VRYILLSFFVCGCLAASACQSHQTLKDSWKFTKRQYTHYLNTPATVDLSDTGNRADYEIALGEAVLNIDNELARLIRAMENTDHNPSPEWALSMVQKFPWISGVALVGSDGVVNSRYPEYFAKEFDASPLLERDPKQRPGMLRGYVRTGDSSPEIYLGNPVYFGEDLLGIIVAHFDPATLATLSPDPDSFVMFTPTGIVWQGRFGGGLSAGTDEWKNILENKSSGTIGSGDSAFFWLTRYIGNLPLVYAIPITSGKNSSAEKPAATPVEQPPASDSEGKKQEEARIIAPAQPTAGSTTNGLEAVERQAAADVPGKQP